MSEEEFDAFIKKLENCKTEEDLAGLVHHGGFELSLDQLETVSGGSSYCPLDCKAMNCHDDSTES